MRIDKYNSGDILATLIIFLLVLLFTGSILLLVVKALIKRPKRQDEKIEQLIKQNEEILTLLKKIQP